MQGFLYHSRNLMTAKNLSFAFNNFWKVLYLRISGAKRIAHWFHSLTNLVCRNLECRLVGLKYWLLLFVFRGTTLTTHNDAFKSASTEMNYKMCCHQLYSKFHQIKHWILAYNAFSHGLKRTLRTRWFQSKPQSKLPSKITHWILKNRHSPKLKTLCISYWITSKFPSNSLQSCRGLTCPLIIS